MKEDQITSDTALTDALYRTFNQRGNTALEKARELILLNCKENNDVSQALRYFSKVTLQNALPVFPALISLACDAVGGNPEKTMPYAEAIVLITGAADLHDDVIDKTFQKGANLTVMGKFGAPVAILAGDVLLSQGMSQIYKASGQIQTERGNLISDLLMEAISEICDAEASEAQFVKRGFHSLPNDYYSVIRHKAVVPELAMKIGAIIGNGSPKNIISLGQFGRVFGIVSIIVEEFTDMFDENELRNRIKNGCPPLPLICALQDTKTKKVLSPMLENLSDKEIHTKLVETVISCSEVQDFIKKNIVLSINRELLKISKSSICKTKGEIETLLLSLLDYFNNFPS
jgi:geranylgeranyl diphosphate synthase type I